MADKPTYAGAITLEEYDRMWNEVKPKFTPAEAYRHLYGCDPIPLVPWGQGALAEVVAIQVRVNAINAFVTGHAYSHIDEAGY